MTGPTLYTESDRVPAITGTGTSRIGRFYPADQGNLAADSSEIPNFTVSVSGALGNSPAVLVIDAADPGTGAAIPASRIIRPRFVRNTQNTGDGNGWASASIPIPEQCDDSSARRSSPAGI